MIRGGGLRGTDAAVKHLIRRIAAGEGIMSDSEEQGKPGACGPAGRAGAVGSQFFGHLNGQRSHHGGHNFPRSSVKGVISSRPKLRHQSRGEGWRAVG